MLAASPWLWGILGALLVGASGAAYVKGRSDGRSIEFAERATLEEVARVARDAAMEAAGEKIASITKTQTTIRQKTEVVTREVPIYRDCINDARVERLLDAARENRPPTEPAGGGELPGAGASPTQNFW